MNIYLHIEISARELDSKLLLAVLAASKGHQVLLSSMGEIIKGLNFRVLSPGIFHTKSLSPGKSKIDRHQKIIDKGSKITSIDEESGIDDYGYNQMAKNRYSNLTIEQSSAVFAWGSEDADTLKKFYPKNSDKIYKTGSPRVDMWKPFFSDYWETPKKIPKKSFLLISTNQLCTMRASFYDFIRSHKKGGYFEREPSLFKKIFYSYSIDYKKFYEFIDATNFLAKNNNGYDIVLRPHPRDNIEIWKSFFEDVSNVHVIRQDSITTWVKNSFAVMHNGCTTAIEATVSDKPVLTYLPFQPNYEYVKGEIPNQLGHIIETKEELLIKANNLFDSHQIKNKKKEAKVSGPISKKLYIDNNELAAEKILKIWESLDDNSLSKSNNWIKFYWFVKIMNFLRACRKILGKLFPNKFKEFKENQKFSKLNKRDVNTRVIKLQKLLSLEENLECRILSDRTILIKKI